jgi:hypothetical protein
LAAKKVIPHLAEFLAQRATLSPFLSPAVSKKIWNLAICFARSPYVKLSPRKFARAIQSQFALTVFSSLEK